jgi:pyruvate/2-oxoglutarate dehydrogenase complex dihydrolipoamide acyltransferase (E2) component
MATKLRMPDMGTVEGQVTLVRWLKAEGDTVAVGEPLFEVETDKGVSEVESALAGVLVRLVLAEGAKAGPGETIAYIRRPGEPEEEAAAGAPAPGPAAPHVPLSSPVAAASGAAPQPGPSIRALAEKHGVDLARVQATGPGGRITRQDVLEARMPRNTVAGAARGPSPAVPPTPAPLGPLALSRGQSIVARKVSQSHVEKPVYRVNALVDMTRAIALRELSKGRGRTLGWDAIFVKTAAMVIEEMPLFRRWFRKEELVEHPAADVALAVGVEEDLLIPVVRGAARAGVDEVSARIDALVKKAQGRALAAEEVEGSCFLVSNLGMFPVESFDAIIYPEHSAALAVGAVTATPVSDGQKIWSAPMARLTLSVDHRLINGKTAARFLSRVKEILEKGVFA